MSTQSNTAVLPDEAAEIAIELSGIKREIYALVKHAYHVGYDIVISRGDYEEIVLGYGMSDADFDLVKRSEAG